MSGGDALLTVDDLRVGFATEDFSALRYLRRQVERTSFHQDLDIIADPDDPRDLYGMIMRAAKAAGAHG